MKSVPEIIALLNLTPHPEGGWYRQTFSDAVQNGRPISTAIYYLSEGGKQSRWHRVDATEIWHWYAGGPIRLSVSTGKGKSDQLLGADLDRGERPQLVIPAGTWQTAVSLGKWTLIGCTVSPGFQFSHFEMQPEGWEPA